MANHETESITIYQKSYQLPVLEGDSFQKIQSQIKQRQQVIKNQHREIEVVGYEEIEKKSMFGLISKTERIRIKTKTTEKLTFEETFQESEMLVTDYNKLIAFFTEHKHLYQLFFAELTSDLKTVVREKLTKIQQQEKKRLELLARATDSEVISVYETAKEQLLSYVWLAGKAFLLMLKKIELLSEGIEKITTDQDFQRQLLINMVKNLNEKKEAYEFQKEVNEIGKDIQELTEIILNLEEHLQPIIGSFQGVINQVCEQDNTLSGTVNEIQSLVEDIMSSNTGSFMSARADDLSKNMLDFLIVNEQKKERLITAVENAQMQGIDWSWQEIDVQDCGDLTEAISAMKGYIDGKLGEYSQVSLSPSQEPFLRGDLGLSANYQTTSEFTFEIVTVNSSGKIINTETKNNRQQVFDLGNGVNLEMVYIPKGSFMMGTDDKEIQRLCQKFGQDWYKCEAPRHLVNIEAFWMAKYPITQAQYKAITGQNPSNFKGDNNPVERVNHIQAQEFCRQLSTKLGQEFSLPSEAQWEYACRAETTTPFYFGETLTDKLANYNANYTYADESKGEYRQKTTPVGTFPPNAFGLYDMHGNVWEWCEDNFVDTYQNIPTDGSSYINQKLESVVLRGSAYFSPPYYCRSASRNCSSRAYDSTDYGFRVVCVLPRTS